MCDVVGYFNGWTRRARKRVTMAVKGDVGGDVGDGVRVAIGVGGAGGDGVCRRRYG